MLQVAYREVDGPADAVTGVVPPSAVAEGQVEHRAGERADQVAVFRQRAEVTLEEQPARGVHPTDERLHARHHARARSCLSW